MSELDVMHILWSISTLACAGSVLGMLWIYKSFDRSLQILTNIIHLQLARQHRSDREHGARIHSMAKDTEMAE